MIDMEIWVGLLALTVILYGLRFIQCRSKRKVYRVSAQSLQRSKDVMLAVLPLVEDGRDEPLDETRLPYPKENVKSAAKILAYYFFKEEQLAELERVKNCYVALSRFQNRDLAPETRERRVERDKERLTRELHCFMTHSPFRSGKAA